MISVLFLSFIRSVAYKPLIKNLDSASFSHVHFEFTSMVSVFKGSKEFNNSLNLTPKKFIAGALTMQLFCHDITTFSRIF